MKLVTRYNYKTNEYEVRDEDGNVLASFSSVFEAEDYIDEEE